MADTAADADQNQPNSGGFDRPRPWQRQDSYAVRCAWGADGIDALADCAVLVIVDVLSFSTSTTLAAERGAAVLPLRMDDAEQRRQARHRGAVIAGDRCWTLRPSSLGDLEPGTLLGLPSPNGATLCALAAGTGARVLIGCLRNAGSVAARAAALSTRLDGPIGVVAAGERWGVRAGPLRPAMEDQLGAGAVIAALNEHDRSPEARVAAAAFTASRAELSTLLHDCVSGRELRTAGHGADIALAAELDATTVVPELRDEVLGVHADSGQVLS